VRHPMLGDQQRHLCQRDRRHPLRLRERLRLEQHCVGLLPQLSEHCQHQRQQQRHGLRLRQRIHMELVELGLFHHLRNDQQLKRHQHRPRSLRLRVGLRVERLAVRLDQFGLFGPGELQRNQQRDQRVLLQQRIFLEQRKPVMFLNVHQRRQLERVQ
jgi:hypothetical protein